MPSNIADLIAPLRRPTQRRGKRPPSNWHSWARKPKRLPCRLSKHAAETTRCARRPWRLWNRSVRRQTKTSLRWLACLPPRVGRGLLVGNLTGAFTGAGRARLFRP